MHRLVEPTRLCLGMVASLQESPLPFHLERLIVAPPPFRKPASVNFQEIVGYVATKGNPTVPGTGHRVDARANRGRLAPRREPCYNSIYTKSICYLSSVTGGRFADFPS